MLCTVCDRKLGKSLGASYFRWDVWCMQFLKSAIGTEMLYCLCICITSLIRLLWLWPLHVGAHPSELPLNHLCIYPTSFLERGKHACTTLNIVIWSRTMAFVFRLCVLALSRPCKHILLYIKYTLNTCRSPKAKFLFNHLDHILLPGFIGTHMHVLQNRIQEC